MVQVLDLSLINCVMVEKLLNFSIPQFSHKCLTHRDILLMYNKALRAMSNIAVVLVVKT
jgi:hypothetical protein